MSEKILNFPSALLNQVKRVALEAGDATLEYFDESGAFADFDSKEDGSPVTIADKTAHDIIIAGLKNITPSVSIISEEGVYDSGVTSEYTWLVDPLDGTRGFIQGDKDYTVNIALIHNHEPILGVVYAPAYGELFAGHKDIGAVKYNDDTKSDKDIRVRNILREGLTIFVSNFEGATPKRDQFLEQFKIEKLVKKSSSLKYCLIASGKGDLSVRFQDINEWDTAAADAVLRAAGGIMTDWKGAPLRYLTQSKPIIFKGFIAQSGGLDLSEFYSEIQSAIV
jgi:3'(2'), 5'-bisphosphate nucleotidase